MTRRRSERPAPPRLPPDLPWEPGLRLRAGSEITDATIQGEFTDCRLEGLSVEDARVVNSSFVATDLNRLRMVDVLVEGSDLSGADMEEASFTRVIFKSCRMSGAVILRSQLRDVSFDDVRLDHGNFRRSTGERLLFDQVNLERGDLHAVHFTKTCFFDCDLSGVDVSEAKLPGARFHGSDLTQLRGGEYLRDVVIDSTQVLTLAHRVFAGLNIRVEEPRDPEGAQ